MKTHKKKNNKKVFITTTIIILAIVAAGVVWFFLHQSQRSEQKNTPSTSKESSKNTTSTDQSKTEATGKQEFLDKEEREPEANPGNESPKPPTASVELEAKSTGEAVVITTKLHNVSGGTCTLTIAAGGASVTKTAQVIYAPEYSSCAGFTINKSEVAGSTWSITLNVKNSSTIATKTLTFTP